MVDIVVVAGIVAGFVAGFVADIVIQKAVVVDIVDFVVFDLAVQMDKTVIVVIGEKK
jgi:hypothetical protein